MLLAITFFRVLNKEDKEEPNISIKYDIIEENGKKGVIDEKNNIIIPCEYKTIEESTDNIFLVQNMNSKYGFINADGQVIVDFQYNEGYTYNNGVGVLTNENGSTYFDVNGKIIGLPNCALEGSTNTYNQNDYLAIKDLSTQLYGFIDIQGNLKLGCKWYFASNFCNNLALVGDLTGRYVIDMEENIIIPTNVLAKYSNLNPVFEKEMIIVYMEDNSCGVLNKFGKEIIPCSLENTYIQILDDSILVNKGEILNYYDFNGNLIN